MRPDTYTGINEQLTQKTGPISYYQAFKHAFENDSQPSANATLIIALDNKVICELEQESATILNNKIFSENEINKLLAEKDTLEKFHLDTWRIYEVPDTNLSYSQFNKNNSSIDYRDKKCSNNVWQIHDYSTIENFTLVSTGAIFDDEKSNIKAASNNQAALVFYAVYTINYDEQQGITVSATIHTI